MDAGRRERDLGSWWGGRPGADEEGFDVGWPIAAPPGTPLPDRIRAAVRWVLLLPFRFVRALALMVLGLALGGALGALVALVLSPWLGWDAVVPGLGIGAALGAWIGGTSAGGESTSLAPKEKQEAGRG